MVVGERMVSLGTSLQDWIWSWFLRISTVRSNIRLRNWLFFSALTYLSLAVFNFFSNIFLMYYFRRLFCTYLSYFPLLKVIACTCSFGSLLMFLDSDPYVLAESRLAICLIWTSKLCIDDAWFLMKASWIFIFVSVFAITSPSLISSLVAVCVVGAAGGCRDSSRCCCFPG